MDRLTKERRSWNMSRIRGRDTRPERVLRSMLHRLGYRFRLHRTDLPGKPDVVLPKHRAAIFMHGCFWHMHGCKDGRVIPKTNAEFWRLKREGNVLRDRRNIRRLKRLGWRVLVVWECLVDNPQRLLARLRDFLDEEVVRSARTLKR